MMDRSNTEDRHVITFSLQSGSNGNCIYVEAGDTRLLFDAGISGKQAQGRMRVRDRDINDVDALVISHDHSDHVRGAGVFHRKFKIPIYMTRPTHRALQCHLGAVREVRYFEAGKPLCFNGVTVHAIRTPHDAADGVAFVIEHNGKRLGILTDLGHPFAALADLLACLDAVYLESNYDPHLLATGPYPLYLQRRISGPAGHLSNEEAGSLIRNTAHKLQWVALAHLSERNNTPELAFETHRRLVGQSLPVFLASRYEVGPVLEL